MLRRKDNADDVDARGSKGMNALSGGDCSENPI